MANQIEEFGELRGVLIGTDWDNIPQGDRTILQEVLSQWKSVAKDTDSKDLLGAYRKTKFLVFGDKIPDDEQPSFVQRNNGSLKKIYDVSLNLARR